MRWSRGCDATAKRVAPPSPHYGLRIRIDSAFVLDVAGTAESTTCTVNAKVPRFVGVPAIAPVAAFSVSPGGSEPEITAHVNGGCPPDTATALE